MKKTIRNKKLKTEEIIAITALGIFFVLILSGVAYFLYHKGASGDFAKSISAKKTEITAQVKHGIKDMKSQIVNAMSNKTTFKVVLSFDIGSAKINPKDLEPMINFCKMHPDAEVGVRGYADPTGSREGNIALSIKRAETVTAFLRDNGCKKVVSLGFGSENHPERQVFVEASN